MHRRLCLSRPLPWPFLLLALLLLISALAPQPVAAQTSDVAPPYRLESGDRLQITVYGHEDLSGEFELDGGGRAALPLIGAVDLEGLTLRQAEAAIEGSLKPDYLVNPRVGAQMISHRPFYILGEVQQPGSYPYKVGLTAMEAVALAGGYTHRAREDGLFIIRRSDPHRRRQDADESTAVLPGDTIRVVERFF